ncbi:MAG: glycosyltransferase family A protein [Candidatus Algichlamydia australiensis]|nr:glycosyltransferase family A protein [Chlamydiales bacterium]
MKRFAFYLFFFSAGFFALCPPQIKKNHFPKAKEEKPFVILIPSYNNEKYCVANIRSALQQEYKNFRVLFINDCSTDRTLELVERETLGRENVKIINNKKRKLALYNLYHAVHNDISGNEIVITLDGDDQLAHPHVLSNLNRIYSNPKKEIWLTYGQFLEQRSCRKGFAKPFPREVIRGNTFRKHPDLPTHLRTFYAWLFQKIKIEDLQKEGKFYEMSWDSAAMIPMIEMACNHFCFVPEVLYLYNDHNPISDHRIDHIKQFAINKEIRAKPAYKQL